ncbi:MAG: HAD family hydrolase [Alphaproteobacteria bacterium]|nr:HAD family hydrolase [Alphaproteobacteria bacterium]
MSHHSFHSLPQAVLFDWDNTLIENWQTLTDSVNAALKAFNLPLWDVPRMMENSKHSMRDSFPVIFGDDWHRARDIFYAHFRENHLSGLHKLRHAEELLNLLDAHGVKLTICSNKNGDLLRREVAHLNWSHYFSSIVGATDAPKDKPDPAPAQLIIQSNNLKHYENVWFIGDTVTDMICGTKSGCLTVGIGQAALENPEFQPSIWVYDLGELLTELKQLLSSS